MQTALLRAITNEKGLIRKSFKIYSFSFSFRWNVQYYSVCNKSIASTANDLLFLNGSYIHVSKESSHTGSQPSQIRHGNNGDLWCHAACHGYVTMRLLNIPSVTLNHLKNRYSQFTSNELTSLKCFLRGMPWRGIPCLKTGRFLSFFFFSSSYPQIGN